jgi:16S rRNA (cytosine967-C5)-methyltransferase
MAANNQAAPNVVRLNLARGRRDDIVARLAASGLDFGRGSFLEETAFLATPSSLGAKIAETGLCCAQSEASQWVARLLAPPAGARVLDCAAAPGGKATHLAELVGNSGRVVALDRNLTGLDRIRGLANRLAHSNLEFICADLTRTAPIRDESFEYVLLDAPCTGLGTLREHPEIRWRLKPSDPARMGGIQSRMLHNVAPLVRRSGALAYSVCSLAAEEGPGVVYDFLSKHPDFALDSQPPVPDSLRKCLQSDGTLLTRPDIGGRDGFFAARLVRRV